MLLAICMELTILWSLCSRLCNFEWTAEHCILCKHPWVLHWCFQNKLICHRRIGLAFANAKRHDSVGVVLRFIVWCRSNSNWEINGGSTVISNDVVSVRTLFFGCECSALY